MFEWLEFWRLALGKGVAEIVFAVISLIAIAAARKVWTSLSSVVDYHRRLSRAREAVARKISPTGEREGDGIWLTQPINGALSETYKSKLQASRVLIVANAKGGVGKTTTVANLGARLAEILPKPVLMIDLDFQGTLSSMSIAKPEWVPPPGSDSRATHLISGDLRKEDIVNSGTSAAGEPKLKIITAFYDLAQAENRILIEWLIGDRKKDIRFHLSELLHGDAVRQAFSLVIVDCPPRFTTATIQALAAGTHLLIPTVMDDPSTEAVATFVRQVEIFKKANVCPYINYIGVVGSLQPPVADTGLAKQRLEDRLAEFVGDGGDRLVKILPETTFFKNSVHFKNAVSNGGIAYIVMGNAAPEREVKDRVIALATHVRTEMKL